MRVQPYSGPRLDNYAIMVVLPSPRLNYLAIGDACLGLRYRRKFSRQESNIALVMITMKAVPAPRMEEVFP